MVRWEFVTQWLPYAIIRVWVKWSRPEVGTLSVKNGPTNQGAFWEINQNEVIFVGDRGAYLKKKAKFEKALKSIESKLEALEHE